MQAISMAIRQLSYRSMASNGMGMATGMNNGQGMGINGRGMGNNGQGMGMRQAGLGTGGRRSQLMNMTQAQSDTRMSQALRTLQGVNMQFNGQGTYTPAHARVGGHIQHAIHELNVALMIR